MGEGSTVDIARDSAVAAMSGIDGWFSDDDARVLFDAAIRALADHPGHLVEVGSWHGRSTVVLAHAAAKHDPLRVKVFAIDPHEGNVPSVCGGVDRRPSSWEPFLANIRRIGADRVVVPVRSCTADLDYDAIKKPISLLFIDGLHDYVNIAADYCVLAQFVPSGGLVAFHDYSNPDFPDVARFVDEEVSLGILELTSLPPSPGREHSIAVFRKLR
jgi:hypothetical protein